MRNRCDVVRLADTSQWCLGDHLFLITLPPSAKVFQCLLCSQNETENIGIEFSTKLILRISSRGANW
jgi:hypothetical protein